MERVRMSHNFSLIHRIMLNPFLQGHLSALPSLVHSAPSPLVLISSNMGRGDHFSGVLKPVRSPSARAAVGPGEPLLNILTAKRLFYSLWLYGVSANMGLYANIRALHRSQQTVLPKCSSHPKQ